MDKSKLYEYILRAIAAKLVDDKKEFKKWANKASALDKQIRIEMMLHASVSDILKAKGKVMERYE